MASFITARKTSKGRPSLVDKQNNYLHIENGKRGAYTQTWRCMYHSFLHSDIANSQTNWPAYEWHFARPFAQQPTVKTIFCKENRGESVKENCVLQLLQCYNKSVRRVKEHCVLQLLQCYNKTARHDVYKPVGSRNPQQALCLDVWIRCNLFG